jgi:hypothetical protein
MLNINMKRQFMYCILAGGTSSVFFLFMLVPPLKAQGASISFLLSELIILFSMILVVRKSGIRMWKTA